MSHATHSNAALTPRARLRLARLIVDHGWSPARAAERYDVSWRTAAKWAARYREEGPAGMNDRSSRPHHQPHRTPAPVVRKIVHLRWKQRLGPVEIGGRLNMPSSTVHAVLVRCRINRLSHIDRGTGEPIRRYEHERPGDLIHVDVKKLGRVPDGGGWRYVGRLQGNRNRSATAVRTAGPRNVHGNPTIGTCYLHTVIDDYSRVAYVEACDDETKETATGVLKNAVAWFADRGVTVRRVLSDNGSCYRSNLWRETCADLGVKGEADGGDQQSGRDRHGPAQTVGHDRGDGRRVVGFAALRCYVSRFPDRVWAIEGCSGIGHHIAMRLLAVDEEIIDIPPKLSARTRVLATGQGRKTDATDAHSVALVGTRMTGLRPVVNDEDQAVLRLLVDRRRSLGEDHTRMVSQLHQLLIELIPGGANKDLSARQAKAPAREGPATRRGRQDPTSSRLRADR